MPSFAGKFRYAHPDGSPPQAGACQVSFNTETLVLTPSSDPPIALDLGDIDAFTPAEYELTLAFYTGDKLTLHQFGRAFQNLSHELLEAYRQRLVQCLLLEDLEEITRFDGHVELRLPSAPEDPLTSPAELRLYKSNLAVLPTQAASFQWRLAEIDAVTFEQSNYAVTVDSAAGSLVVSKLAKRTREFCGRLEECITLINEKSAQALHEIFPFLNPNQFQAVAALMKEGHAASLDDAGRIHPQIESALLSQVVDARLKPYFDALAANAASGPYVGFKFIRKEDAESEQPGQAAEEETLAAGRESNGEAHATSSGEVDGRAGGKEEQEPILHWFFFPMATQAGGARARNLLAWEATSKTGRATYFFRLVPPEQAPLLEDPARARVTIDTAIQRLNRALVLLNFRREPIYLPDDALLTKSRLHCYAIACRRLPELRRLRASFLGRAIHTSPDAWGKQFQTFLSEGQV